MNLSDRNGAWGKQTWVAEPWLRNPEEIFKGCGKDKSQLKHNGYKCMNNVNVISNNAVFVCVYFTKILKFLLQHNQIVTCVKLQPTLAQSATVTESRPLSLNVFKADCQWLQPAYYLKSDNRKLKQLSQCQNWQKIPVFCAIVGYSNWNHFTEFTNHSCCFLAASLQWDHRHQRAAFMVSSNAS